MTRACVFYIGAAECKIVRRQDWMEKRSKFSEEMKILQLMKYLASPHAPRDSAGFTAHYLARTAFSTRFGQGISFGEQRDEDIKKILTKLVARGFVELKAGTNIRYAITEEGKVAYD
jgi:hypothetical protein